MAQAGHDNHGWPLEQELAPEERARLHQELREYSDRAYPEPQRMQQRREEMRQRMRERLRRADEDHDGGISQREAGRHMPRLERRFDRLDLNRDGIISQEELDRARRRGR